MSKSLTPHYSAIQGLLWTGYASLLGFASVYLLEAGFTNTQIGILSALASLLSAAIQPAVAAYADRPESLSVRKLVVLVDGLLLLDALVLLTVRGKMVLTGLFFGCGICLLLLMTPLVNALGTGALDRGRKLNFGVARGTGSAGYGIAAFLLGRWEAELGTVLIPISMVVIFGALLAFTLRFPFEKTAGSENREAGRSLAAFCGQYWKFLVVCVGCTLLYTGHNFITSFNFQILTYKGGGSRELGLVMALSALVELPTLFLFSRLRKLAKAGFWLKVSGIFMTLKILGTLLASSLGVFYAVQLLQMLGYALLAVATVFYASSAVAPGDAVKGQAFMTMANTVGTVLGSVLGGPLLDHAGVPMMLIVGMGLSGFGAVLVLLSAGERKQV